MTGDISGVGVGATIPPIFSSSWGSSESTSDVEQFFAEEKGLFTAVVGTCVMYRVSLNTYELPPFTSSFKAAIMELIAVTNTTDND